MSELKSAAEAKLSEMKNDLLKIDPGILDHYPIESSLTQITNYPAFHSYKSMCTNLEKLESMIASSNTKSTASKYYRLALVFLINDSERHLNNPNFPTDIISLFEKWFERVLRDLNTQPESYYSHKDDSFLKDLAVCSSRMIPVGGSWTVETGSASRRALIANGVPNTLGNVIFHAAKQRGLKPYFIIHTFDRYIMRFTSEEMEKAYLRIAGMLRCDPKIKGIYRSSWFLDPEINRISPRLSFLRKVPEGNGARFFKTGTRNLDIQRATCNSPERKKLYDEGKYEPACWGYVWPRDDVLEWAGKRLHNRG